MNPSAAGQKRLHVQSGKAEKAARPLTVVLLGASFTTHNLGVEALACGTVASVCHAHPDARLFLIDYAKEPAAYPVIHSGGIAKVELINIRFSKRFYLRNNIAYLLGLALGLRFLPSREWRTRILQRHPVLKAIREADLIGSLAGGDSFSDLYGLGRLIYVALPQILVLLLGKPLVLLPQTVGPFAGGVAKAVARYILRRARVVYSRDHDGLGTVRGLLGGKHGRLQFGYDMGFALEPRIRETRIPGWLVKQDPRRPLVGLNVSGLLYIGGYTQNNMFGIKADYRRLIHRMIEHFIRRHEAQILLVPHVLGGREDGESDLSACLRIYGDTADRWRSCLHPVEEGYDAHEIKALIGRCDFFIGARMHACIAALSQCVPAAGLAYSWKFRGVFASIGMEDLVIDLREQDEASVVEAVNRDYELRAERRARLEAKIPSVRAAVLGLFSQLHPEADPPQEEAFETEMRL